MFQKIHNNFSGYIEYEKINWIITDLLNFFNADDKIVKWININNTSCSFNNMPLHLNEAFQSMMETFDKSILVSNNSNNELIDYQLSRLGLKEHIHIEPDELNKNGFSLDDLKNN